MWQTITPGRIEGCAHAEVTWDFKGPQPGMVALIDGMLFGTCDDCGAKLCQPAVFTA